MRIYYLSIFALGLTVGILHAITLSSATDAVLQVIGAVVASVIGLIVGQHQRLSNGALLAISMPHVAGIVGTILIGYWAGWAGGKVWINHHYRLGSEIETLTLKEQTDARRLIAVYDVLGVPPEQARARIVEIAVQGSGRACRNMSVGEQLSVLHGTKKVAMACGFKGLSAQMARAENALTQLKADPPKAEGPVRSLVLGLSMLPPDQNLEAFADQVAAGACRLNVNLANRLQDLVHVLDGCVPTIEAELARVLATSPELKARDVTRGATVNETLLRDR